MQLEYPSSVSLAAPAGVVRVILATALLGLLSVAVICCIPENNLGSAVFAVLLTIAGVFVLLKEYNYRQMPLSTINFGVMLFFYPVTILFNCFFSPSAIRPDLWREVDYSLSAYVLGAAGLWCSYRFFCPQQKSRLRFGSCFDSTPTSIAFNIALTALSVPIALFKMNLNLYYHISVNLTYGFENGAYLNLLETLTWISYLGCFMQLQRYLKTKSKLDVIVLAGCVTFQVGLYMPSGSRMQALAVLPGLIFIYLGLERRLINKFLTAGVLALGVLFLVGVLGAYRVVKSTPNEAMFDRVSSLAGVVSDDKNEQLRIIAHRLGDFVGTGRVIAAVNSHEKLRGFAGMETWWQIVMPGFLRPAENGVDFNEGAKMALFYHISDGPWVSTPITIMGDLYSRFGAPGIMIGMFLMGMFLVLADSYLLRRATVWSYMTLCLYLRFVWQFYVSSLLMVFTAIERDFVICLVVALVLSAFYARIWQKMPSLGRRRIA